MRLGVALVGKVARRVWLIVTMAVLSFGNFRGRRGRAFAKVGFDRCTFVSVNVEAAKATGFARAAAACSGFGCAGMSSRT